MTNYYGKNNKKENKRDILKTKQSNNMNSNNNANNNLVPHFSVNQINRENRNNITYISTSTNESNIEINIEKNELEKSKTLNGFDQFFNSSNKKLKKHTQGITAVAAQKKATQHHRDLIQDPDENNNSQFEIKNNESNDKSNLINLSTLNVKNLKEYKKPNMIDKLTIGKKTKKNVKIKENSEIIHVIVGNFFVFQKNVCPNLILIKVTLFLIILSNIQINKALIFLSFLFGRVTKIQRG